jgi:hypothetical protein
VGSGAGDQTSREKMAQMPKQRHAAEVRRARVLIVDDQPIANVCQDGQHHEQGCSNIGEHRSYGGCADSLGAGPFRS